MYFQVSFGHYNWFVNPYCTAHRISPHNFLHKVYVRLLIEHSIWSIWKHIVLAKGFKLEKIYHKKTVPVAGIPTGWLRSSQWGGGWGNASVSWWFCCSRLRLGDVLVICNHEGNFWPSSSRRLKLASCDSDENLLLKVSNPVFQFPRVEIWHLPTEMQRAMGTICDNYTAWTFFESLYSF